MRLLSLFALTVSCLFAATPENHIVRGTVYNLFHEEFATDAEFQAAVDRDLPAIAAAHLDTVMIFPMSEWDPETKALRWDRTDYLIRKIEALHLKFVPLMLKEEQCSHYFPIWKFKDLGLWEARNQNNGSPNNRENVDFADPAIFPLVDAYFKAVVDRYGKSPALAFYNVWNEPHYSATSPHVVEAFREYLKNKYKTLATLRRVWGDDYTSWDQVTPFLNDDWNSTMPGIDWAKFRVEFDGVLLGRLTAALRKYDPVHAINANPVGTPFASFAPFGGYNTDNWQFTPHNDFNGASYYPDAWARDKGLPEAPLWFHNLSFNVFRNASAEKGYILTELYTHVKSGLTLGGHLAPDTATRLAWDAVANDCKGIIWWKWQPFFRGRQALGRGLVEIDGELAPRGEAVRDVAAILEKHESLFSASHPLPAKVGILVDLDGLLKVQLQTAEPKVQDFMYRSIAGTFRAFDDVNIPVDLLRTDRSIDLQALSGYKLLVLPFQLVLRKDLFPVLQAYVKSGGTLLADARTATSDEFDFAYTPPNAPGLEDFLGVHRKEWTGQVAPAFVNVTRPGAPVYTPKYSYYRETLVPRQGSEIFGRFFPDNAPALVAHTLEKGRVWYAGFPVGGSAFDHPDFPAARLLQEIAAEAGVEAPVSVACASQEMPSVRIHKTSTGWLAFIVQRSSTPVSATVTFHVGAKTATDLLTGKDVMLNATPSGAVFTAPANAVTILKLEP